MLWILMVSLGNSQTISKEKRVKVTSSNEIVLSESDAKIVIGDLLKYELTDVIIKEHEDINSFNLDVIKNQNYVIDSFRKKDSINKEVHRNLEKMLLNKEEQVRISSDIINSQEKRIKKEVRKTRAAITGGVITTIGATVITFLILK